MGVTISYGPYNGANEFSTVTSSLSDANHPGTLMSAMQHNALGKLTSATDGNNAVFEHYGYTNRGWLFSYWNCQVQGSCDAAHMVYTFNMQNANYPNGLSYAPNGNVLYAGDWVNGNWTYSYDDFNRLSTAVGTSGFGCSWDYDRYGNRWHQNPYNGSCTAPQYSFTGNNNRMDCASCYDAAGNLLNDGVHGYTYDAENRLIQVDGGSTATYVYDAESKRIRKTVGGVSVDFLYDTAGNEITEVSSTGVWNRGEVYANSRHLATYRNGTTYFDFSDWSGTERVRTTLLGSPCESTTSLPFGDNQVTTGSCDVSPMHFTGKERDAETTLDNFGARYGANTMGRFMTTDPTQLSAFIAYPQTWNRYSYAHNNPIGYIDRNGKWPTSIHNRIVETAFGGILTPSQIKILERVSAHQDSLLSGGQGNSLAFQHAMRGPGESVSHAEAEYNAFVALNEDEATRDQINFWVHGNSGYSDKALAEFAAALHAILDSTSPAHSGFQVWDWRNYWMVKAHINTESTISSWQLQVAVATARAAFNKTFHPYHSDEFDFLPLHEDIHHTITFKSCNATGSQDCTPDQLPPNAR
jgi:RHS repeat-associated protein